MECLDIIVQSGQFGKVISNNPSTNINLWALGKASFYILNPSTTVTVTLPPISDNILNQTSAFNGHVIVIINTSATNDIILENSDNSPFTSIVFSGVIRPRGYIKIVARASGWLCTLAYNFQNLQTMYDDGGSLVFTNSKPMQLIASNSTGYIDFNIKNGANGAFRVRGLTSLSYGVSGLFGSVSIATPADVLCFGNNTVLNQTNDKYVFGRENTIYPHVNLVHVYGRGNIVDTDNLAASGQQIIIGKNNSLDTNGQMRIIGRSILDSSTNLNTNNVQATIIGKSIILPDTGDSFSPLLISNITDLSYFIPQSVSRIILFGAPNGIDFVNGSNPPGIIDHDSSYKIMQGKATTNNNLSVILSVPRATNTLVNIECQIIGVQVSGSNIGTSNGVFFHDVYFTDLSDVLSNDLINPLPRNSINGGQPMAVSSDATGTEYLITVSSAGNTTGLVRWYGNFVVQRVYF